MELLIIPPNIQTSLTDFRFNNWGDLQEDVIKNEGFDPELRSDTLLFFESIGVGNIKCDIHYGFSYSRLVSGFMEFRITTQDLNQYILAYNTLKQVLIGALGTPDDIIEEWTNERYLNNYALHGFAIKNGDYKLSTGWLSPSNNKFLELDNTEEPLSLRFGAMAPKH